MLAMRVYKIKKHQQLAEKDLTTQVDDVGENRLLLLGCDLWNVSDLVLVLSLALL